MLGYKTKIVVMLFASYVVGKAVFSLITLAVELGGWLHRRFKSKATQKVQSTETLTSLGVVIRALSNLLAQGPDSLRSFVGGFLAGGPALEGKFQALEYYSALEAGASFHLSTGLAFLLLSIIPGDGAFRWLEALFGTILFLRGVKSWRDRESLVAGYMGIFLREYLAAIPAEKLSSRLKYVWSIIVALAKTPARAGPTTPSSNQASDSEGDQAKSDP